MSVRHFLWILMLVLAPTWAAAQNNSIEGAYVGAYANTSFENFGFRGLDFDDGVGAGGRIGSRLNRSMAIEAQYEWSGRFEDSIPGFRLDLEQHVVTANLRLFLISGPFEPFVNVGVGYARAESETTIATTGARFESNAEGLAFRGGVGALIPILPSAGLMVSGDYVLPTGDVADLDYFSVAIGLNLNFRGL